MNAKMNTKNFLRGLGIASIIIFPILVLLGIGIVSTPFGILAGVSILKFTIILTRRLNPAIRTGLITIAVIVMLLCFYLGFFTGLFGSNFAPMPL